MKSEPDLHEIRLFSPEILPDNLFGGRIEPPPRLKDWLAHITILNEIRAVVNELKAGGLVTRRSEWLRAIKTYV
ncbi:hypothetical protein PHLCEN_2v11268 [Hermanssonia centrifuga]|uniref:Uncharacterized protein n=1 Tax=Hermanssonia centrifuga TaxID=98765 RepID=A0A2R6NKS0_9APHY|nr:hypothetical protein PHLCEN_2v11268 [Hermanssonia centrifuga]